METDSASERSGGTTIETGTGDGRRGTAGALDRVPTEATSRGASPQVEPPIRRAFGLAHWNEGALRRLSYHGHINYIPGYLHWYTGSSLGVLLVMKHHGRFSCEKKRDLRRRDCGFSLALARYHVIRGGRAAARPARNEQQGVQQQNKALAGEEEEAEGRKRRRTLRPADGWCGTVASLGILPTHLNLYGLRVSWRTT